MRTCLFCGGAGSSREHIIAQWIGRALDLPPVPGVDFVYLHRSENPEAGIPVREKQAERPAYFTRAFCRGCNGGWMARLEQRVRPVLEPLLLGRHRTLSNDDQRLLAMWAMKTILAFQSVEEPITTWARVEDYRTLYRSQAPLPNSQVWLGANFHGEPSWYRAHSIRLRGSAAGDVDGFGATLTVGHTVFYLVVGYAAPVGMRLRHDAAVAMKEIWPRRQRDVTWPPPLALRNEQPQGLPEYLAHHSVLVGA